MSKYGRDELEWDELVEAGTAFLVERARLDQPTTTYTELNTTLVERTGLRGSTSPSRATGRPWGTCSG